MSEIEAIIDDLLNERTKRIWSGNNKQRWQFIDSNRKFLIL